jgi:hypothetical protein
MQNRLIKGDSLDVVESSRKFCNHHHTQKIEIIACNPVKQLPGKTNC